MAQIVLDLQKEEKVGFKFRQSTGFIPIYSCDGEGKEPSSAMRYLVIA